jgi:nicotinamidase/pyrazinamidase
MKKLMKTVLWTISIISAIAVVIFGMTYWSMRPTTGTHIDTYSSPRTALLIIDIQEDYTGPRAKKPYRERQKIVTTANALTVQAIEKDMTIIFIHNIVENPVMSYFMDGVNKPGAPGTEMDERLIRPVGSKTFQKSRSDAFSNPDLDTYLRKNQVDHLLITGLDAAYCVNATIRGGLNRGYKITVYSNGIATESPTPIDNLLKKWEAQGVKVKSSSDI